MNSLFLVVNTSITFQVQFDKNEANSMGSVISWVV